MKKMIIALLAVVMSVGVASAQNYMVIDSEKVFKSVAAYNEALEDIEQLATQYQEAVDKKFAEVENLYNNYMQQRASLSVSAQQQYEQLILQKEAEATEYQESLFGTDGTLMNKRLELIQPIQKKVFDTIKQYAEKKGYDMIIDISQNATMLYYSERADHTDEIIAILK
jgi:outer membrane protein